MAALAPDFDPNYVPPGHGEPDYSAAGWGRGSNLYSDDEWAGVLDAPAYIPPEKECGF